MRAVEPAVPQRPSGDADADADAAERELIAAFGLSGIVAAGAADARGRWLLEVYADGRTADLHHIEGALRLLAAHAAQRARGVAPLLDPLPGVVTFP